MLLRRTGRQIKVKAFWQLGDRGSPVTRQRVFLKFSGDGSFALVLDVATIAREAIIVAPAPLLSF